MKTVAAEKIASRIEAHSARAPRLVVAGNCATPRTLLHSITEALAECRLFSLNAPSGWPLRDGVINETPFVGPGTRSDPSLEYLPMRLSLVPRLFTSSRPPDAVLLQVSRPRGDRVSMGIEVTILPAAVEAVRARGGLVLAQINPTMPYTFGDSEIPTDSIDLAVEADEALVAHDVPPPDEAEQQIG